ncbi:argininosuccinate lyase, partial [Longicatena caecimuris]
MNVWDARFKKAADARLNDFNSSISVDHRMYAQDIKGSCAHAMMLAHEGIISLEDSLSIITGLTQIQKDIESGALAIDETAEDIHMFMESELTKRIQDAGKRLHTARSRNDQVALDTRMYALDETDKILTEIKQFINVLLDKAQENLDTIMPGYTHLQRAQPITFAHHLMAYVEMLKRDLQRLQESKKRTAILPLGSGALATTTYPINREMVKEQLDFDSVSLNSLDGVS